MRNKTMHIEFCIFFSAVVLIFNGVSSSGTMLSRKDDFLEPVVTYSATGYQYNNDEDNAVDRAAYYSERTAESSSANEIGGQRRVFVRRTLLQFFDWKSYEWPMGCSTNEECSSFGIRMACINKKCACEFKDYVLLLGKGCYPTANLFHHCITSEQCVALNKNSYCNQTKRCTCTAGYYFDGRDCVFRYDGNLKAQEVYKAAVVAAACFIVAVVGIFVACIVRRSFCRREANVQHSNSTSSDVFSVSDEIAALRAVDKPPSYEEVLQIERTFYGIPPPEYTFSGGDAPAVPSEGPVNYPNLQDPELVAPPPSWPEVHQVPCDHQTAICSSPTNDNALTTVAAIIATSPSTCEVSSQTINLNTTTLSPAIAVHEAEDNTAAKIVTEFPHHPNVSAYPLILHPSLLANSDRSSRQPHQCYTPPLLRPSPIFPVPATCLSAPSSPHQRTSHVRSGSLLRQAPAELPTTDSGAEFSRCGSTVTVGTNTEDQSSECPGAHTSGTSSVAYDNPAFVEDHEK